MILYGCINKLEIIIIRNYQILSSIIILCRWSRLLSNDQFLMVFVVEHAEGTVLFHILANCSLLLAFMLKQLALTFYRKLLFYFSQATQTKSCDFSSPIDFSFFFEECSKIDLQGELAFVGFDRRMFALFHEMKTLYHCTSPYSYHCS